MTRVWTFFWRPQADRSKLWGDPLDTLPVVRAMEKAGVRQRREGRHWELAFADTHTMMEERGRVADLVGSGLPFVLWSFYDQHFIEQPEMRELANHDLCRLVVMPAKHKEPLDRWPACKVLPLGGDDRDWVESPVRDLHNHKTRVLCVWPWSPLFPHFDDPDEPLPWADRPLNTTFVGAMSHYWARPIREHRCLWRDGVSAAQGMQEVSGVNVAYGFPGHPGGEVERPMSAAAHFRLLTFSKAVASPYGYSELSGRDYEAGFAACKLLKPSIDHLEVDPLFPPINGTEAEAFAHREKLVAARSDIGTLAQRIRDICEEALAQ